MDSAFLRVLERFWDGEGWFIASRVSQIWVGFGLGMDQRDVAKAIVVTATVWSL